ncbi:sugar ABC transporter ATP-binding protein, partial [Escherichia coli]
AGLEEVSSGQIVIGKRVVNDLEPKERDIAMVFQNYALYPHMTVYQNMAYGLKIQGLSKTEIDERVQRAAAILELGALL